MKKILLLCFMMFFLTSLRSSAQNMYMSDVSGRPILGNIYANVTGSPYLNDDWVLGSIVLTDAKAYENVSLKYDEINDDVIFKGKDGVAMAADNVKQFKLAPYGDVKDSTLFRSGFPAVKSNTVRGFYEVLVDGKVKLLKKTIKTINQFLPENILNSASVDKTVVASSTYYLFTQSSNIVFISKDKKSVLKVLTGKEAELDTFISANKLNLKNDADLAKLVTYYNGL
ncbi:hypothetical protein [Pedobacter sp. NJ-S-72]